MGPRATPLAEGGGAPKPTPAACPNGGAHVSEPKHTTIKCLLFIFQLTNNILPLGSVIFLMLEMGESRDRPSKVAAHHNSS